MATHVIRGIGRNSCGEERLLSRTKKLVFGKGGLFGSRAFWEIHQPVAWKSTSINIRWHTSIRPKDDVLRKGYCRDILCCCACIRELAGLLTRVLVFWKWNSSWNTGRAFDGPIYRNPDWNRIRATCESIWDGDECESEDTTPRRLVRFICYDVFKLRSPLKRSKVVWLSGGKKLSSVRRISKLSPRRFLLDPEDQKQR